MRYEMRIQDLWDSAASSGRAARTEDLSRFPASAQRYLEHAIAPGAPLAHAVRLQMHGEIKLQRWLPFTAEEVIAWGRGFIWSATVRMSRWGNPDGSRFRYVDFGALIEEENTFQGYTIPTRLRIGWYIGTDRFDSEGEFFS